MRQLALAILIFFVFEGAACAQGVKADIGEDGVQRVEVVSDSYYFKPDHIILKINVPCEMNVRKRRGMVSHNLVIRAPEAGMDINVEIKEEERIVRFTPTSLGFYNFYCDKRFLFFRSHRDKGMEGIIEVVE